MENKVLVRTENRISFLSIICFVLAILVIVTCFVVASAVSGGDPSWAFRGIRYGYWGFFVGAAVFIVIGVFLIPIGKDEITVTEKFVYVKTIFSKIAMPVEKITCVKKGLLKTVMVVAPSSRVSCLWIEKDEEVYNCLIKLICEK